MGGIRVTPWTALRVFFWVFGNAESFGSVCAHLELNPMASHSRFTHLCTVMWPQKLSTMKKIKQTLKL